MLLLAPIVSAIFSKVVMVDVEQFRVIKGDNEATAEVVVAAALGEEGWQREEDDDKES